MRPTLPSEMFRARAWAALQALEDVGGIIPKGTARIGQADIVAAAVKQLHIQSLLQGADLTADGGLGNKMSPGCLSEIQCLRHSDKISQLVDIHWIASRESCVFADRKSIEEILHSVKRLSASISLNYGPAGFFYFQKDDLPV